MLYYVFGASESNADIKILLRSINDIYLFVIYSLEVNNISPKKDIYCGNFEFLYLRKYQHSFFEKKNLMIQLFRKMYRFKLFKLKTHNEPSLYHL